MLKQNRRSFIKQTLAGTGLLASGSFWALSADQPAPRSAVDRVTLGKTGIKVSFLAQGTGFNGGARSSEHTRMGQQAFSKLLNHSIDEGINFLDMADLYGSHPFVRNTIKSLPREKFVLLTKLWPRKEDWNTPSGGAVDEINRFRKELDVEMIDICLIHCMMEPDWPNKFEKIRDDLSALKQKGVIRATGVSCHDFGALKAAANHPWVDVIFARINNKGKDYYMDGSAEEVSQVLKQARSNGKAIVGMKIFGAGKLVKPEEKDASLKYVIGNNLVDAMTIGMLNTDQVDDSVNRITNTLKAAL